MTWDAGHLRAAGFTLQILRPAGKLPILTALYRHPHLRPTDIARHLGATPEADAPLLGVAGIDLAAVSHRLGRLRGLGLAVRCAGTPEPGGRAAYEITRLGAGMVGSLEQARAWGVRHFDLAERAARERALMDSAAPAPGRSPQRRQALAAVLTLGMLDMRWSFSLLAQVRIAGDAGVESGRAQEAVNVLISGFPETVRHGLGDSTRHAVLRHLESSGLVFRRREPRLARPARVLYVATQAGAELMDALVPVARWGVPHDAELSSMMARATAWFAAPDR